jgi:hypothetical protein
MEPSKVIDRIWKVAGGGCTYFDAENSQSADTFLAAMTTWHADKNLVEFLKAKRIAIKLFQEKRGTLEKELVRLIYKTQLKGRCDLTKP